MSRVLTGDGEVTTSAHDSVVYVGVASTCGRINGELGVDLTLYEAKQLHKQLGEEIKTAETQEER